MMPGSAAAQAAPARWKYLVLPLALAGLISSLLLVPFLLVVVFGGDSANAAGGAVCQVSVDTSGLTINDLAADQIHNAGIVYAQAKTDIPQSEEVARGAVIAIATALQESTLRNLNYGDRDSLGLFQQRAAWGPTSVRTDPAGSAHMFFTGGQAGQRGLLDIPSWPTLPLTVAAQAVQVSAFPDAYGKWESLAGQIVQKVAGAAISGGCTSGPIGNCPKASAAPRYPNGKIPLAALCQLANAPAKYLRGDAAYAFMQMSAAYAKQFAGPISVTDAYRSYEEQERLYKEKGPGWAAKPGTSNHGWGTAVDLGGGVQTFGSTQRQWMVRNAPRYGWVSPDWAQPGQPTPEPWHWEYRGAAAGGGD